MNRGVLTRFDLRFITSDEVRNPRYESRQERSERPISSVSLVLKFVPLWQEPKGVNGSQRGTRPPGKHNRSGSEERVYLSQYPCNSPRTPIRCQKRGSRNNSVISPPNTTLFFRPPMVSRLCRKFGKPGGPELPIRWLADVGIC